MNTEKTAQGLAAFSLIFGVFELLFAPALCETLGLKNREDLVRAFGVREFTTGLGIFWAQGSNSSLTPWLWGRVGGDALDSAVLGGALLSSSPKRGNVALAILLVSPIVALDIWCALRLQAEDS